MSEPTDTPDTGPFHVLDPGPPIGPTLVATEQIVRDAVQRLTETTPEKALALLAKIAEIAKEFLL